MLPRCFPPALICLSFTFLSLTAGWADDAPNAPKEAPKEELKEIPEPAPPALGNGIIRIQGGQGQIQLQGGGMIQIQGGGNIQINGANIQVQAVPAAPAQADPAAVAPADVEAKNPSWLGIQMESKANLDLDEDEKPPPGVGVLGVVEKGPAAKAGLKAFDRILKIDDKELKDELDLRTTVRATKPGTKINLKVLREGKEIEIKVDLEAMPAEANMGMLQGFGFNGSTKPGQIHFYNLPNTASDPVALDAVLLNDGNRLEGGVMGMTNEELTFRLASGPEIPLDLAFVQSIRLLGGARAKILPATILLTDGSTLAGSELSYQDGKFSLNLENQHVISLPRDQVSEAAVSNTEAPQFYAGPKANDGWKSPSTKGWTFADGVWIQSEPQPVQLSRKFSDLPPSLELEFDFQSANSNFELTLFNQKQDFRTSNPGMVQVRWAQDSLNIGNYDGQRYFNLEPLQPPVKPAQLNPNVAHHFRIYANRTDGRLAVFRDEFLLGEFTMGTVLREDFPRAGRVISMIAADCKFSNIHVRPWHGPVPSSDLKQDSDRVTANPDQSLTGNLTTLSSNEILLQDQPSKPRTLPLAIRLKPQPATMAPGKIQVETKQGSSFAAQSVRMADKTLFAITAFAGEIAVPVINLRSIEFRDHAAVDPLKPGKLDVLTFRDGKQLTGTFTPPIVDGHVSWAISAAKAPLRIALAGLKSLLLAPRSEDVTAPTQVVKLQNGDWFPAEILAIDASTLTVKTAFNPEWKLPREQIATIYSPPAAKYVADAASGRKRWRETTSAGGNSATFNEQDNVPQQVYSYSDGSYRIRTQVNNDGNQTGLALPIPAEANDGASIEFTMSGVQNWTIFTLMDAHGEGAFSFYSAGDTMRVTRIRSAANLGNRKMESFQFGIPDKFNTMGQDLRYQIVLDKANASLHVGLNGQKLGTCKLKNDDPWTEITRLVFFPTTFGSAFKISNVWMAPWNGSFSVSPNPASGQVALTFINGDDAQGKLLGLNQNEAEVDTEGVGPLTLPLPRLRSIGFGGSGAANNAPYRIHLYDRGQVSGSELTFNDNGANLTTAHGMVTLPMSMVKEIILPKAD